MNENGWLGQDAVGVAAPGNPGVIIGQYTFIHSKLGSSCGASWLGSTASCAGGWELSEWWVRESERGTGPFAEESECLPDGEGDTWEDVDREEGGDESDDEICSEYENDRESLATEKNFLMKTNKKLVSCSSVFKLQKCCWNMFRLCTQDLH